MELSKEEKEAIKAAEDVKDVKLYSYAYVKILLNIIEKLQKENEKQEKVIEKLAIELDNNTISKDKIRELKEKVEKEMISNPYDFSYMINELLEE